MTCWEAAQRVLLWGTGTRGAPCFLLEDTASHEQICPDPINNCFVGRAQGSLARSDGDANGAGFRDAPVPSADPDSTWTGDLSLSMSQSGPATQEHGVF